MFNKNKKGLMNQVLNIILSIVLVIVGFIVVFYIVGNLSPTLTTAAGNISNSGLPLAGLFTASGILMILFMIFVFLALLLLLFALVKSKGKY